MGVGERASAKQRPARRYYEVTEAGKPPPRRPRRAPLYLHGLLLRGPHEPKTPAPWNANSYKLQGRLCLAREREDVASFLDGGAGFG